MSRANMCEVYPNSSSNYKNNAGYATVPRDNEFKPVVNGRSSRKNRGGSPVANIGNSSPNSRDSRTGKPNRYRKRYTGSPSPNGKSSPNSKYKGSSREPVANMLFAQFDSATWNQVDYVIDKVIKDAMKLKYKCIYKMVMPKDALGNYKGFSFIWFSNIKVVNMIMGKNPDGTDRVNFIDDPKWKAPPGYENYEETIEKELEKIEDWGEKEERSREIEAMYIQPKIKITLDPLIKVSKIKQRSGKIKKNDIDIKLSYATVRRDRPGLTTTVISGKIPDYLEIEELCTYFSKYVTIEPNQYPKITITKKGNQKIAYVHFSRVSLDAQIAQRMNFDTTYNSPEYGKIKFHFVHPDDKYAPRTPSR